MIILVPSKDYDDFITISELFLSHTYLHLSSTFNHALKYTWANNHVIKAKPFYRYFTFTF